ncbi:MAG: LamG domain-containing protein [Candidatus Aminicenantes bacterium]|nr:MAG: LamG domain-containing protein [Candidatus Aminicenantes bacterium]
MKKEYFDWSYPGRQRFSIAAAFMLILILSVSKGICDETKPVAWWAFEGKTVDSVQEKVKNLDDPISGNFRIVSGVSGEAIKFDGYTTIVTRKAGEAPVLSGAFTIEAWVAIAAYPWSWCPVISHAGNSAGYALEIGPGGELAMKVFSGSAWRTCISDNIIPLSTWAHVAGVFDPAKGLAVFIDGQEQARLEFQGRMNLPRRAELIIGSVPGPEKPAYIHREHGTIPDWYSLDAILDEIKIHGKALGAENFTKSIAGQKLPVQPDIAPRVLPSGPAGPGRFGAYYTHLEYYWEWDDLWRIGDHPDVVVQFDNSPVRVVFWRGTRYSPAWVTENNLWMADQSVEAWNDDEGCFEHMQDRHCRYSHVRIIENTPARVVVQWRYAPVSAFDNLRNVDPRTSWGCWVDEYYYIYPDQTGIRNYNWEKGSLGRPRQFQESIPLTGPGQVQGDVVNEEYVTIANLKGQKQTFSYIQNPPRKTDKPIPENPMIQMHNLKSENKPFIIFEPGGRMHYLKDMNIDSLSRPGSCSHWPVGQMRCDGRTQWTTDRAASFLGFPITDPVIHTDDDRLWISSLYGMNDKSFDFLIPLAKSWVQAPKLEVISGNIRSDGYDFSQRAYRLNYEGPDEPFIELMMDASPDSPMMNGCFILKNWGEEEVVVAVDGRALKKGFGYRIGYIRTLEGCNLVVWIEKESVIPVKIKISNQKI